MKVVFTAEIDDLNDKLVKGHGSNLLTKYLVLSMRFHLPDGASFVASEGLKQADSRMVDQDTGIERPMTREEVRAKLASVGLTKAGLEILRVYGNGIPSKEEKARIMGHSDSVKNFPSRN